MGNYGYNLGAPLNGQLDQTRFFNTVLTASQVSNLYNVSLTDTATLDYPTGAGCLAAYQFDTNANTILSQDDLTTCNFPSGAGCQALYQLNENANDTCGNHNGTATSITYTNGAFDKAATFDGTNSWIDTNTTFSPTLMSFSAWVYPTSISHGSWYSRDIISNRNGNTGNYNGIDFGIVTGTGNLYTRFSDGSNSGSTGSNTVSLRSDVWTHVAFTVDTSAGEAKVYKNGSLAYTVTIGTGSGIATGNDFYIGRYFNASEAYWNGKIDQARIFNTALTQSQITALSRGEPKYNATNTNVVYNGFTKFQPGLTWIKRTSSAEPYALYDSIRGANEQLSTDSNGAQATNTAPYEGLTSFDSYGFSLDNNGGVNASSEAYASWNWKSGNEMWALDLNIGTTTGYVDVPNGVGALGNATSDLSFSCWFKIPDASIQSFIICSYVNPNYSKININTETNGKLRANFGDGTSSESSIYTTSTGWADGNWHHLAYTMEWNSGSSYFDIKFYKDGSLDSSHTTSGQTVAMSGNGFTFGGQKNTTSGTISPYSTAQIGQARLYNSVLSSTQVTELHNQKATKYNTLDFPTGAGCVAAYNFKGNPDDLSGTYNGQGNNDLLIQIGKDTVNTDGSITSTVTANQDSGFSIVKYIGNNTSGATIGHSLNALPHTIVVKRIDSTGDWIVYNNDLGATKYLLMNSTTGAYTASNVWNDTAPTSTVFSIGNYAEINTSGGAYIAYCWTSKSKYSKIGTYVGNRPTTVTITTDFEPGWVLIKDTANSEGWVIIDNKRGDQLLEAQSTAGNTSYNSVQFTSTGFTVGDSGLVNTSGATITYMAFAK